MGLYCVEFDLQAVDDSLRLQDNFVVVAVLVVVVLALL